MKIIRQNQILPALVLSVATLLLSCGKNTEEALELISDSEAAEMVENTVTSRSAGTTMPTVDMAELVEGYLQNCGTPGDTTLQRSNTVGSVTYSTTLNLGWIVNCNNAGIPQNASATVAGNGSFNTARWSGSDTSTGTLTFTGLNPAATAYVANGSYTIEGDVTGTLRNSDPTLHVTTTLNLTDFSIRKSDYYITGGTGTAVLVATNGRGRTETVNATLVFNGDGTATVTVNGHSHNFPV